LAVTRLAAIAAVLLLVSSGLAVAQDRPLIEPLRIGYARAESIGDQLRHSASLQRALWRKGFALAWHPLADGLSAIRALDAGEIDIALDVALSDVVAARREDLSMVFIANLRSIAPSCCDLEQIYADHMFKRYTLSSEYLADWREDALLILHMHIIGQLQQKPEPIPVAYATPSARDQVVVNGSPREF
jgi:hypothetical protein